MTSPPLLSHKEEVLYRLKNDFPYFAANILKIKDKRGQLVPFFLNTAQTYIHSKLKNQLNSTGKVRLIILKCRQMGGSTFTDGWYYQHSILNKGQSVFILTHERETTDKLFRMVERYYENTPPSFRPNLKVSNRKKLIFEGIESEYSVGTAGNTGVGVGGTVQLFHGSELPRWENEDELVRGIMQSIASVPGTQIIFESTALGMNNKFYEMCMDALQKKKNFEFELVFVPWFWQEEYRAPLPCPKEEFKLSDEEKHLQAMYKLSLPQLQWRRVKVAEMSEQWFRESYPCDPIEAFQSTGESLYSPDSIMKARKSKLEDREAPLVIGVDPARSGDRTVIVFRRGRHWFNTMVFNDMDEMRLVGLVGNLINTHRPAQVFIDVGQGYGTIDRLRERGYARNITEVHFGGKADDSDIYLNKRAEMLVRSQQWLEGECRIPDEAYIHSELSIMPGYQRTSSEKIVFPPKDKIKKENGGRSTDIVDAFCLTFAYPVMSASIRRKPRIYTPFDDDQTTRQIMNQVVLKSNGFRKQVNSGPVSVSTEISLGGY